MPSVPAWSRPPSPGSLSRNPPREPLKVHTFDLAPLSQIVSFFSRSVRSGTQTFFPGFLSRGDLEKPSVRYPGASSFPSDGSTGQKRIPAAWFATAAGMTGGRPRARYQGAPKTTRDGLFGLSGERSQGRRLPAGGNRPRACNAKRTSRRNGRARRSASSFIPARG